MFVGNNFRSDSVVELASLNKGSNGKLVIS